MVTSLGISSRLRPIAILAVTLAIGYPVALLASADERLTLGLTSTILYSPSFTANWILHPPSIPRLLIMLILALRSIW